MGSVISTKSEVIFREDERLGPIVYSPYTGLIFACQHSDKNMLLQWLNRKCTEAPAVAYLRALGPGWAIDISKADFPAKHLLPFPSAQWPSFSPSYPIVINWLLTGMCNLKCRYCYADDVMKGGYREPDENQIHDIANAVLSYRPIAVVLTGGDPLLSSHLVSVLRALHKRTGIIVDTNGMNFSPVHVKLD